jgi:LacI family transcriptional regulator
MKLHRAKQRKDGTAAAGGAGAGRPAEPPKIAIIANPAGSYVRGLISGITAYAHDNGPWAFTFYHDPLDADLPRRVRAEGVAGVLARIHTRPIGVGLARLGVPVVDLLEEVVIPGVPQVVVDDRAVARLALEHLLDRGIKTIAFLGLRGVSYSEKRQRNLVELCRDRGPEIVGPTGRAGDPLTLVVRDNLKIGTHGRAIAAWIQTLPKPVGIVACNDVWASVVLWACWQARAEVPDQVAVIGVDDDPTYGRVAGPTLSSVDPDTYAIGYQAAAMLAGMMAGTLALAPLTHVAPRGVAGRRSTDMLAYADPALAEMVRYVRDHACDGMTVGRMVKRLGVSRSTIERLFAEHVGRSPGAEIARVRLARAHDLLTSTNLTVDEVAHQTGFAYTKTLRRAFKARYGVAPAELRTQKRPSAEGRP